MKYIIPIKLTKKGIITKLYQLEEKLEKTTCGSCQEFLREKIWIYTKKLQQPT